MNNLVLQARDQGGPGGGLSLPGLAGVMGRMRMRNPEDREREKWEAQLGVVIKCSEDYRKMI